MADWVYGRGMEGASRGAGVLRRLSASERERPAERPRNGGSQWGCRGPPPIKRERKGAAGGAPRNGGSQSGCRGPPTIKRERKGAAGGAAAEWREPVGVQGSPTI